MRAALQRLLLAVDRGDPATLTDALLEIVERPDALDEDQLHRSLGRFLARHVGLGLTPDVTMFTDLFRIVSEHGLSIPPEIAAVFRALATMEGTLTRLAPGSDIVAEARRFAADYLAEQLRPESLRQAATDRWPSMDERSKVSDLAAHREGRTAAGRLQHNAGQIRTVSRTLLLWLT
jgi:ubiquinone biosynthesis protein